LKDYSKHSDEQLVIGALEGNRQDQEALYYRFSDQMYTIACIYSKNDDEASDILQESFIKVFKKLSSYRNENPLGAWIRKIVVNSALENHRKKKRQFEVLEEYHSELMSSAEEPDYVGVNPKEVIRLVNELPFKAGMVLKLFAIEGFAHDEIAESLGISVGTSKSQLSRARQLLKQKLITSQD